MCGGSGVCGTLGDRGSVGPSSKLAADPVTKADPPSAAPSLAMVLLLPPTTADGVGLCFRFFPPFLRVALRAAAAAAFFSRSARVPYSAATGCL